jgi:hypothetical protein
VIGEKPWPGERMPAHYGKATFLAQNAALIEVETLLKSPPGMLALALAFPRRRIGHNNKQPSGEETFFTELNRMREICAQAIAPGFGAHPNFDHAKFRCAFIAKALMGKLSKNEVTGTEDAPFRAIATLLYEAVSRQPDVDLKRACDAVLRDFRH